MKIAIAGKGGVGKTAFAAGLARVLADQGRPVVAIDADPDQNLGAALGLPVEQTPAAIATLGEIIEERIGSEHSATFRLNPEVSDLPERCSADVQGVRLLVMGTVAQGGKGCMCRPNTLLRTLVRHLMVERDEIVIMDMVAGIEHLGRGTASHVDLFAVIVEPHARAMETAARIQGLTADLGVDRVVGVANKVRSDSDRHFIHERLAGLTLLGTLRYSEGFLERVDPVANAQFMADVSQVAERLVAEVSAGAPSS